MKKTNNSFVPNLLLGMAGGIQYRQLVKADKNPRKASEQTLRNILTYAKDTVYGREHDFDYILQAQDDTELYKRYQEKVPVNDFEALRPYVERHKHGEEGVLFPGKPVHMARLMVMIFGRCSPAER